MSETRRSRRRRKTEEAEEKTTTSKRRSRKQGKEKSGNPAKVVTGVCRGSYVFLNELRVGQNSDDGSENKRCTVCMLIPKDDEKTVEALENAIEHVASEAFGSSVNVNSRNFGNPLRDGDEELESGDKTGEEYEDHYFANAASYSIPQAVDENAERIIDPDLREELIRSGNYFRFSIVAKSYNRNQKKGVRLQLGALMFVKEGEPLGNVVDAEKEFEDYA